MAAKSPSRTEQFNAPLLLPPVAGALAAPMPDEISPQLAMLTRTPPVEANWIHEMKYDGYRMLGRIDEGTARLISRHGQDWTDRFPDIAAALERLPVSTAWIDVDVVVTVGGRTSFRALQMRSRASL